MLLKRKKIEPVRQFKGKPRSDKSVGGNDRKDMTRALLSYMLESSMDVERRRLVMEVLKERTKGMDFVNSIVTQIWMHLERDGYM